MVEGCRRKRSSLLKNSIVELIDEEKRQILLSLHGDSQHFQQQNMRYRIFQNSAV